jgi:cytidylate kinase
MLASTVIEFLYDEHGMHVLLDGTEVTQEIRTQEISQAASIVSTLPMVRQKLVQEQQRLGKDGSVVVEGRDIGTVVFPDAALKIFMTASPEKRIERRKRESASTLSLEELRMQMRERDERDASREYSPLIKADDAIVLDTSEMTIDEQVSFIVKEAQKKIVV